MNVLDLKNHVNFRKGRRGQGLLPRKEREEIRLILWKHVHESFILEELFQSFCCFCGNMLMNV